LQQVGLNIALVHLLAKRHERDRFLDFDGNNNYQIPHMNKNELKREENLPASLHVVADGAEHSEGAPLSSSKVEEFQEYFQ